MTDDVRKEQLALLQFEKKIVALAAFLGANAASAASAAQKIDANVSLTAYADIKAALIHLADVTSNAHASLEQSVADAGVKALEASGGLPKSKPYAEVIRSLAGIG